MSKPNLIRYANKAAATARRTWRHIRFWLFHGWLDHHKIVIVPVGYDWRLVCECGAEEWILGRTPAEAKA